MPDYPFEMGPIRPVDEADSLLIRTTRGCPWNRCEFCSLYRDFKFSMRSVDEVKADIMAARDYFNGHPFET
ncbi:MAG: radical SAM protein, partial [Desulfobacterales bacterium]|nr:radical SAM protein [Desulfobacterales bacterium]